MIYSFPQHNLNHEELGQVDIDKHASFIYHSTLEQQQQRNTAGADT